MTQFAIPTSDIAQDAWIEGVGDGDGDAFDELDEGIDGGTPDDDTTYWQSPSNPSTGDAIRCAVALKISGAALEDPGVNIGHILKARCRKDAAGGRTMDVVVRLFEGVTQRASASLANITDAWTTISVTLTAAEADAITDYTNLRIEVDPNSSPPGAARRLFCTAMEFEFPDLVPMGQVGGTQPYIETPEVVSY